MKFEQNWPLKICANLIFIILLYFDFTRLMGTSKFVQWIMVWIIINKEKNSNLVFHKISLMNTANGKKKNIQTFVFLARWLNRDSSEWRPTKCISLKSLQKCSGGVERAKYCNVYIAFGTKRTSCYFFKMEVLW